MAKTIREIVLAVSGSCLVLMGPAELAWRAFRDPMDHLVRDEIGMNARRKDASMTRRFASPALTLSHILLALLWGHPAFAEERPAKTDDKTAGPAAKSEAVPQATPEAEPETAKEALGLAATAMSENYLAADFAGALAKLERARKACEKFDCSKPDQARILRDLATAQIVGLSLSEAGKGSLVLALQLNPKLALDPDLATPELKTLFAEVGGDPNLVPEPLEQPVAAQAPAKSKDGEGAPQDQPESSHAALHTADNGAVTIDICPPDFPGCSSADQAGSCTSDTQCDAGLTCNAGECVQQSVARNGVSLGLQQDLLLLPSSSDICSGTGDWACFNREGSEEFYDQQPFEGNQDGNAIVGGAIPGTLRILAGYDRFLGDHFGLGVRAGFAFGGGPRAPGGKSFVPWHAEARVAYWLGALPFATKGFHPFVLLGGGVAQIDTHVKVTVFDGLGGDPSERGGRREVDAWLKTGTAFAEAGFGALYALAPGQGPMLEFKTLQMFGVNATNVGLLVGYQVGL